MKSITIHGLDDEMEKLIKKRARSVRTSVNKTVKELLGKALGLGVNKKDNREDFIDLFGIWTEDDEKNFTEAIKDLETVNPVDWQ
jgi:plasmid stability protein